MHLAVGRLEQDRERGVVDVRRAREERRQGIVLGRELLPAEEEQRDVVVHAGLLRQITHELERHRDPAFHVARADAVHRAVRDAGREVPLCRDGVVVPAEHDQRRPRPPLRDEEVRVVVRVLGAERGRDEREHVCANLRLVEALRRDVDQLACPLGETVREIHDPSLPGHNLAVTARQPDSAPGAEPERGFVVGVFPKGVDGAAELAELRELARTAGVATIGELVQHRNRPDPRTFVGKGKLAELKREYTNSAADVLLVDEELSPTQQRSLEDALQARVVDRTQLILDIFAQHARSAEGKLQVELAQLEYNLPRMRGLWKHLERLGGGRRCRRGRGYARAG